MNKKLLFFFITILLISPSFSFRAELLDEQFIILGPYPQNTDYNSTYIIWQTSDETNNNIIFYGLTTDMNITFYDYNYTDFHKIKINDLQSSSKYYYKVKSNNYESKIYSFYTSFEGNVSGKFIVYGDSRGVWDNWYNASIVAKSIEIDKPQFVLHTGDFVRDGRKIDQWIDFFSFSNFSHNCTIYPTLGNHEYYGDSYFQYFSFPNDKCWYSFDKGPVHFIALDSNKLNLFNLNQTLWLFNDLKNNEKPFTIVFYHHPSFSSGNHGSSYLTRLLWSPLFSYFDIDIVFNGHDHSYERGLVNSVYYIVTGGGGAPLYNIRSKWWTVYSEKAYHFCLLNVENNVLNFNAKRADGSVIDCFTIDKN